MKENLPILCPEFPTVQWPRFDLPNDIRDRIVRQSHTRSLRALVAEQLEGETQALLYESSMYGNERLDEIIGHGYYDVHRQIQFANRLYQKRVTAVEELVKTMKLLNQHSKNSILEATNDMYRELDEVKKTYDMDPSGMGYLRRMYYREVTNWLEIDKHAFLTEARSYFVGYRLGYNRYKQIYDQVERAGAQIDNVIDSQ